MTALVFLDTETTGLALDDDIWEFAAIRRESDGSEEQFHFFIQHSLDKCEKLPEPFRKDHNDRYSERSAITRKHAMTQAHSITAGAHIVGAVPNFDTERIAIGMRKIGLEPAWHYHLIDVENISVGFLSAHGLVTPLLPWDSDELSVAVGVDPNIFIRHTALGDVLWARAIYDKIIGEK